MPFYGMPISDVDLAEFIKRPRSVTVDGNSYTNHSLSEVMAAKEKEKQLKTSTKKSLRGAVRSIFCFRVGPPGGRGY